MAFSIPAIFRLFLCLDLQMCLLITLNSRNVFDLNTMGNIQGRRKERERKNKRKEKEEERGWGGRRKERSSRRRRR